MKRTITIETTRNGFRHAFSADVKGRPLTDGTLIAPNGIRWKV